MSEGSIFGERQERIAWFRRVVVWLLFALIWSGIVALFVHWWNTDGFIERSVAVGVLAFFSLVAIVETWMSRSRLSRSKELLASGSEAWDVGEEALSANSPWVKRVAYSVASFAERTRNEDGSWDFEELPDASRFVDPIWNQAEKSSTMLRWFSGGAVLVGLLGTLYGLGGAIEGALNLLAQSGKSGNFASGFEAALAPLQYAFFASGAGVANSLGLILIRKIHQSEIDAHFGEIELELSSRMHDQFFSDWRPPSVMFVERAEELEHLNRDLMEVVDDINKNTAQVIETSARTIEEKFEPLPGKILDTMNRGMKEATTRALGRVKESQKELSQEAEQIALELKNLGQTLPEKVENAADQYATILARKEGELGESIDKLDAAVGELQTDVSEATNMLTNTVGHSTEQLSKSVEQSSAQLSEQVEHSSNQMAESVNAATDDLKTTVKQSHETFGSAVQGISDEVAETLETSTESARKQLEAITEDHRQTVEAYDEQSRATLESYQEHLEEAVRHYEDTSDQLIKRYDSLLDSFEEQVRKSVERLGGQVETSSDHMAESIDEAASHLKATVEDSHETFGSAVQGISDEVAETLETSTESARKQLEAITEDHRQTVEAYDEQSRTTLESYQEHLEGALDDYENASEQLLERSHSLLDDFDEKIRSSIERLRANMEEIVDQTDEAFGKTIDTAVDVSDETSRTAERLEGLVERLEHQLKTIRDSVDRIEDGFEGRRKSASEVTVELQEVAENIQQIKDPLEKLVRVDTAHRQTLRQAIESLDANLQQLSHS